MDACHFSRPIALPLRIAETKKTRNYSGAFYMAFISRRFRRKG
jgi:hypothetical protein